MRGIFEPLLEAVSDLRYKALEKRTERGMEMNLCIIAAYDGSRFAGWQKNKNTKDRRTLQGIFEMLLTGYFGQQVQVKAAGRTDAGVNAAGQVLNFHVSWKGETAGLRDKLNAELKRLLKKEEAGALVILEIRQVDGSFHSRFDAAEKTYEYYFDERERPSVFARHYTYPAGGRLDVGAMRRAAEYLTGTNDFRMFSGLGQETEKDTVRTLSEIRVERIEQERPRLSLVRLSFTGNGFLYHMARILAGTLLEVGQGARTPESMDMLLHGGIRSKAGAMLPAQALFLKEVRYLRKKNSELV